MSGLLLPVAGGTLTQHFGNQSNYLEYGYWHVGVETAMFNQYPGSTYVPHYHAGTDWAAAAGTNVRAMEAGTVVYEGWAANPGPYAGGGIIVEVAIAGGMHYVACHLSSSVVAKGQMVSRGQTIGRMGSTGVATGPHDHCSVSTVGSYGIRTFRNPEQYITGGSHAGSSLILPSPVSGTNLVATVGPGNVTAYHIKPGTLVIDGHKTVYFKAASFAGKVVQGVKGYYLCKTSTSTFYGLYLISGKSGPFTVKAV